MTTTDIAPLSTDAKAIAEAKLMTSLFTTSARREYLTAQGSVYADNSDPVMVDAAFFGHVLSVLDFLARRFEQEIARHA